MFKNAYPNTSYINLITDDLPLISQIKWRIYGQNFTKQDFEKFLKENKEVIKSYIRKMEQIIKTEKLIINSTEFYIWSEEELIKADELYIFCSELNKKSKFNFYIEQKEDYILLCSPDKKLLNIKLYNEGYVFFVEGEKKNCMRFLYYFDKYFDQNRFFYVSPSQMLDENNKFLYPRNADLIGIAFFLDIIFNNTDHSDYIKSDNF